MGCCGGGIRARQVKRQTVSPIKQTSNLPKTNIIRKRSSQAATPAHAQRQLAIPHHKCPKCGYSTMIVHITGRERYQCTNANCRNIMQ